MPSKRAETYGCSSIQIWHRRFWLMHISKVLPVSQGNPCPLTDENSGISNATLQNWVYVGSLFSSWALIREYAMGMGLIDINSGHSATPFLHFFLCLFSGDFPVPDRQTSWLPQSSAVVALIGTRRFWPSGVSLRMLANQTSTGWRLKLSFSVSWSSPLK